MFKVYKLRIWCTYTLWKFSLIDVINTSITSYIYHLFTYLFMVKTFKFHSLEKKILYNTVPSAIIAVYFRSLDLIHFIIEILKMILSLEIAAAMWSERIMDSLWVVC